MPSRASDTAFTAVQRLFGIDFPLEVHRDAFFFCQTVKMLRQWGMHLAALTHRNPSDPAVAAVQMQAGLSTALWMSAIGVSVRPAGRSGAFQCRPLPFPAGCPYRPAEAVLGLPRAFLDRPRLMRISRRLWRGVGWTQDSKKPLSKGRGLGFLGGLARLPWRSQNR